MNFKKIVLVLVAVASFTFFGLAEASIDLKVEFPSSGDAGNHSALKAGDIIKTSWISANIAATKTLSLYLSSNQTGILYPVKTGLPLKGSYEWKIPSVIASASDYTLSLSTEDKGPSDGSLNSEAFGVIGSSKAPVIKDLSSEVAAKSSKNTGSIYLKYKTQGVSGTTNSMKMNVTCPTGVKVIDEDNKLLCNTWFAIDSKDAGLVVYFENTTGAEQEIGFTLDLYNSTGMYLQRVFEFVKIPKPTGKVSENNTSKQVIKVLTPSGSGGTESFTRGESIPYTYTLSKNSKKLEVSLHGGPNDEEVYNVKRYDGWGLNKKVISARDTAKLAPGQYGLLICDYTEDKNNPVCDGSDGVIVITDDAALAVAPKEEKEQKIEIKSPNGGEQFYKGESINYNYKLAKNTQNLLIELVEADKKTIGYTAKRYDGWGDNRKTISKEDTKKIPSGMYLFRICDTSTKVPVCDVSDGRITIVDKLPTSQILAPVLTKVESKAAEPNELFAGESAVVYGTNIDKYTKIVITSNTQDKEFVTKYTQAGSITIKTFANGQWPDGTYKVSAMNGDKVSNTLTVTYKNPKKEEVSDEGKMNGSCILVRNLTVGSRGEDVSFLQAFLRKKNISIAAGEDTGYFGAATKAAVIEYQTSLNMGQPNGFVGALTLAKINAECNSSSSNTNPNEHEDEDSQQSSEDADPQKRISGAPTDACRNIPGDQASIPQGYTNTGVKVSGNCKKIGAKDEFSEPVDNQDKTQLEKQEQKQKIEEICQILKTTIISAKFNQKEEEWKTVKCDGDAFKNAKQKEKRKIPKKVEKSTPSSSEITYPTMIELELGATHEFVKIIQQYLNSNGYIINEKVGEPGSVGYESDYFGEKTKQALIKFQKDKGISPAHGYFGPKTRAAMGI